MVRYCVFVAVTVYFACDFPKSVFIAHTNMYGSDSTGVQVYCRVYVCMYTGAGSACTGCGELVGN